MAALPSFAPRPYGSALRLRRRRSPAAAAMAAFMGRVIAAVNARGLCAADVARVAELPPREIAGMAARCGCRACFLARAN